MQVQTRQSSLCKTLNNTHTLLRLILEQRHASADRGAGCTPTRVAYIPARLDPGAQGRACGAVWGLRPSKPSRQPRGAGLLTSNVPGARAAGIPARQIPAETPAEMTPPPPHAAEVGWPGNPPHLGLRKSLQERSPFCAEVHTAGNSPKAGSEALVPGSTQGMEVPSWGSPGTPEHCPLTDVYSPAGTCPVWVCVCACVGVLGAWPAQCPSQNRGDSLRTSAELGKGAKGKPSWPERMASAGVRP